MKLFRDFAANCFRRLFLALFCVLCFVECDAQNWQMVTSHRTSLFQFNTYTRAIRIDSVLLAGSDSIFVNYRSIDDDTWNQTPYDTSPQCVMDTSWIGSCVLIRPNGENVFVTESLDSVLFKTHAIAGETWTMFHEANGNYVDATVTLASVGNVLSLSDSIKEISLQKFDYLGNPLPGSINGHQFTISKSYGLVRTLPIRHFPTGFPGYDLIGFDTPAAGEQNLTAEKIFDFDIGDVFQYTNHFTTLNTEQWHTIQYTITGKTLSPGNDSAIYTIDDSTWIDNYTISVGHEYFFFHTVKDESYLIRSAVFNTLDVLPHEISGVDSLFNNCFGEQIRTTDYNSRPTKTVYRGLTFDAPFLCGGYHFLSGHYWCWPQKFTFVKGLGKVLEENVNPYATRICEWFMNYYKKGAETWGIPVNLFQLVHTNEMQKKKIQISPNPFSEKLFISNLPSSACKVDLIDVLGRVHVSTSTTGNTEMTIDTRNIVNGIYFFMLSSETGIQQLKIIKN